MKAEASARVSMKVKTVKRPVASGAGDLTSGYMKVNTLSVTGMG